MNDPRRSALPPSAATDLPATTDQDYRRLLSSLSAELGQLVAANATHQDHLHSGPEARVDVGGMWFCPGCRLNIVSRRVAELVAMADQDAPLPQFGGRTRKDVTVAEMLQRQQVEAATKPATP